MTFSPQPSTLRTTAHGRRVVAGSLPWMACVISCAVAAADEPSRVASRVIVDPQVTTAGGHACRSCGSGQCGLHGHCGRRHHPDCRDGECVPFCPVRPSTFGFYDTQWRRWPGQGVVPASAEDAATPMPPPKSAVPGPDEESPMRPDEPGADADVNADRMPADGDGPKSDEPKSDEAEDANAPAQPTPTTQPPATSEKAEPEQAETQPETETAPDDSPAEPMPERKPAPTRPAPQRLPTLEDILGGEGAEPAPTGRDPLPRDADAPAEPSPDEPADAPAQGEPVPDPTPGDDTGNPFEDDAAIVPDQGVELVGFRYPAAVGASLEPGGRPWRLAPPARQRPAGSPRGR